MKKILFTTLLVGLVGCASNSNYRPVLDTFGDQRPAFIVQDIQECQLLAQQSSVTKGIVTNGLTGALVGGGLGAAVGALGTNPAAGAALGGTIGGVGGALKGGWEADETYKRIFRNCLRNRGHRVVD